MRERLAIGMMSGTSCDGIDAALVAVQGCGLDMKTRLVAHLHRAFAPELRRRLLAVMAPARTTVDELLALSVALANAHLPVARAVRVKAARSGEEIRNIAVVGVHGQTICHRPPQQRGAVGASWQLGQFAPLAAGLHLPVVADFRAADLAVGGQGAPLVPWTDLVLARHPTVPRVLINLGGVCNATFLPAGCGAEDVRAGDIGPCNILLDGLIAQRTKGQVHFDRNGRLAAGGRLETALAEKILRQILLATSSADRPGPQSLGREQFSAAFLRKVLSLGRPVGTPDLLAAAVEAVARRLSWPIKAWAALHARGQAAEIILAGGGCHNRALLEAIRRHLPGFSVAPIDSALGIPAEAKEAVSFALLALANLDNIPTNLPAVTGASRPAILGVRLPAGSGKNENDHEPL